MDFWKTNNNNRSDVLSYIKSAIRTQTIEEMAADLHRTLKQVRYLIERYRLDQYCVLPKTDRIWDLIGENKVQCAVCGMWMRAINGAHLSKHDMSIAQYKGKFGLNKSQPLCCKKLSEHWKQKALKRGFGQNELSSGKKLFLTGKARAKTYKKSRQAIEYRIEKGYQSKAARAKKPREYLKYTDLVRKLRDTDHLTFVAITNIIEKETGFKLSELTIRRTYYGKRTGFRTPKG